MMVICLKMVLTVAHRTIQKNKNTTFNNNNYRYAMRLKLLLYFQGMNKFTLSVEVCSSSTIASVRAAGVIYRRIPYYLLASLRRNYCCVVVLSTPLDGMPSFRKTTIFKIVTQHKNDSTQRVLKWHWPAFTPKIRSAASSPAPVCHSACLGTTCRIGLYPLRQHAGLASRVSKSPAKGKVFGIGERRAKAVTRTHKLFKLEQLF